MWKECKMPAGWAQIVDSGRLKLADSDRLKRRLRSAQARRLRSAQCRLRSAQTRRLRSARCRLRSAQTRRLRSAQWAILNTFVCCMCFSTAVECYPNVRIRHRRWPSKVTMSIQVCESRRQKAARSLHEQPARGVATSL